MSSHLFFCFCLLTILDSGRHLVLVETLGRLHNVVWGIRFQLSS